MESAVVRFLDHQLRLTFEVLAQLFGSHTNLSSIPSFLPPNVSTESVRVVDEDTGRLESDLDLLRSVRIDLKSLDWTIEQLFARFHGYLMGSMKRYAVQSERAVNEASRRADDAEALAARYVSQLEDVTTELTRRDQELRETTTLLARRQHEWDEERKELHRQISTLRLSRNLGEGGGNGEKNAKDALRRAHEEAKRQMEDLRKQLTAEREAMRKDYEDQIRGLQKRIDEYVALEESRRLWPQKGNQTDSFVPGYQFHIGCQMDGDYHSLRGTIEKLQQKLVAATELLELDKEQRDFSSGLSADQKVNRAITRLPVVERLEARAFAIGEKLRVIRLAMQAEERNRIESTLQSVDLLVVPKQPPLPQYASSSPGFLFRTNSKEMFSPRQATVEQRPSPSPRPSPRMHGGTVRGSVVRSSSALRPVKHM